MGDNMLFVVRQETDRQHKRQQIEALKRGSADEGEIRWGDEREDKGEKTKDRDEGERRQGREKTMETNRERQTVCMFLLSTKNNLSCLVVSCLVVSMDTKYMYV